MGRLINIKKYLYFLCGSLLLLPGTQSSTLLAQSFDGFQKPTLALDYEQFVDRLGTHNLGFLAEKYNLDIADAQRQASKALPDPELGFSVYDNQNRRMKLGYGFEVGVDWDLELGRKRKARQGLAEEEHELAFLELSYYFLELRYKGTLAYLEALEKRQLYELKKASYDRMVLLAQKDSLRLRQGVIKSSTAAQSRLEAMAHFNEQQDAFDEWTYSLMELSTLISLDKNDTLFIPQGSLSNFDRDYELNALIGKALNRLTDLGISRQQTMVAQKKVGLAKAERVMDLRLNLGVENSAFEKNIIGPTPGKSSFLAGVAVPLKFSNNVASGLKIARFEQEQAELLYTQKN